MSGVFDDDFDTFLDLLHIKFNDNATQGSIMRLIDSCIKYLKSISTNSKSIIEIIKWVGPNSINSILINLNEIKEGIM